MIVDCDRCEVRGNTCQDCVITVLLGTPQGGVELDGAERRALDALAEMGMVPRLQLVDRLEDHTKVRDETGAHVRNIAKRSATDGERSIRYVS
jgi:hypothetical protein